ncbi:hypothetical protein A152_0016685 [Vibrio tasmaniensis 1F-187]|uniref:hypothetical protein n=1 Tax=unclassified Vibrio TaxID=2614977 RepID=UPI0018E9C836|nr:hypothetical protein [Vibrio tasmaniensis]
MQDKLSSFSSYLTSGLLALTGAFSTQDWAEVCGDGVCHVLHQPRHYTQTITSKDSQGNWTRGYYYQNGTSLFECSNDGVNWSKETCK